MSGLIIVRVLNLCVFNLYSTSFKTLCLYYFAPGHLQDEAKERKVQCAVLLLYNIF